MQVVPLHGAGRIGGNSRDVDRIRLPARPADRDTGPVLQSPAPEVSRELFRLVELVHAPVYYVPERAEVYDAVGFRGGWMAYFATRSAALGAVPPAVVTACFFGFAHAMVARALPDAWSYASPGEALAARYAVVERSWGRLLGAPDPTVAGLADDLTTVVAGIDPHGAPLFAAHASLEVPTAPYLRLFRAATALRELRGDAHVTALRGAGIGPVESHVLMAALDRVPADQRRYRGWSEDAWADAARSLAARGWLDDRGRATELGRLERERVEQETDRLSAVAWQPRGRTGTQDLVDRLAPLVHRMVAAGGVPQPNGMGVPTAPGGQR